MKIKLDCFLRYMIDWKPIILCSYSYFVFLTPYMRDFQIRTLQATGVKKKKKCLLFYFFVRDQRRTVNLLGPRQLTRRNEST